MSNHIFDDFLDLDQMSSNDLHGDTFSSYFLNDFESLQESDSALAAVDGLPTLEESLESAASSTMSSPALLEDLLGDMPMESMGTMFDPEEEKMRYLLNQDTSSYALVDPAQLSMAPSSTITSAVPAEESTIASLALPSTSSSTITSTSTAQTPSPATATAQIAALIDSSKNTTSSTKRPNPEPSTNARKVAKTEASTRTATATASTSSTVTAAVSSTSTAPVNTTLSAATLQFLLEQQIQTPLIPQLFTGKLTREEIETTLARLLESTKHLIETKDDLKIKVEGASDDEDEDMDGVEHDSAEHTHGLKTQPGIKTDDIPSSTDLKKMTSKERRQLRNKISARNFRVRRKEYIGTLEGQVLQHKTEARHLREAVTLVQDENKRLKEELEVVKRQLTQATISNSAQQAGTQPTAPLSKENQSLLTALLNRSAIHPNAKSNPMLPAPPRPQSPILKPNFNKDVASSPSVGGNSWKDNNPTFVHTTLVPEVYIGEEFSLADKIGRAKEDGMLDRPWMKLGDDQESSAEKTSPLLASGIVFELMQTAAWVMMAMAAPEEESAVAAKAADERKQEGDATEWAIQESIREQAVNEEEEIAQLLFQLYLEPVSASASSSLTPATVSLNETTTSTTTTMTNQEDDSMLEWLYESMMARLVDLDLKNTACPERATGLTVVESVHS